MVVVVVVVIVVIAEVENINSNGNKYLVKEKALFASVSATKF